MIFNIDFKIDVEKMFAFNDDSFNIDSKSMLNFFKNDVKVFLCSSVWC